MSSMMKSEDSTLGDKVMTMFQHKSNPETFNRPINTTSCPHHRLSRIIYVVLLPILILISIPVVTLKALTYSFTEDNHDQGFMFESTEKDGEPGASIIMAALPKMLNRGPVKLALIAAVLSILLAVAHLGFVVSDWKSGKKTQSWAFRRNIMFLHITNGILILFALVSIVVTHKNTSHFKVEYVNSRAAVMNETGSDNVFRYSVGTFDLETWTCELKEVPGAGMARDDYSHQCDIEVAGRAIIIPYLIITWLVAFTCVWALVAGGRRGPDGERVKTSDVGLEMGKMNATD